MSPRPDIGRRGQRGGRHRGRQGARAPRGRVRPAWCSPSRIAR